MHKFTTTTSASSRTVVCCDVVTHACMQAGKHDFFYITRILNSHFDSLSFRTINPYILVCQLVQDCHACYFILYSEKNQVALQKNTFLLPVFSFTCPFSRFSKGHPPPSLSDQTEMVSSESIKHF